MIRAFGSERFSRTYNVPSSKAIVSPVGVVSDAGSMMISPGFRALALVSALGADCGGFRGVVDWAITCGKTKIRAGIRTTAARGFIFQYPFRSLRGITLLPNGKIPVHR